MSDDMKARVEARAAKIRGTAARIAAAHQAEGAKAPPPVRLEKSFVLDCLARNRVGDAALFCVLFRHKYVFVQEWEKFLYWAGHHWELDKRNRRALADAERLCAAYQDAWAQSGEEEGAPLHKLLVARLKALRSAPGRRELLECVTTIDDPPVISAEQLDQQPYLLGHAHRRCGSAQRRVLRRPPGAIHA